MKLFEIHYSVKNISTFAPLFVYAYASYLEEITDEIAVERIIKFGSYVSNKEEIENIKIIKSEYKPNIAFVSGHLDVTKEEFNEFYIPKITESVKNGDFFVVGDADGADKLAQKLLSKYKCGPYVSVYHMLESPRNNEGNFDTVGGFKSDNERDTAMTKNSDYDIAWIRPGKEQSGTAKNIERRNKISSKKNK